MVENHGNKAYTRNGSKAYIRNGSKAYIRNGSRAYIRIMGNLPTYLHKKKDLLDGIRTTLAYRVHIFNRNKIKCKYLNLWPRFMVENYGSRTYIRIMVNLQAYIHKKKDLLN